MNATPRLSTPAAASDPSRSSASAAPSNAQPDAKTLDFAAALSDVGAKPARKASERKTTNTGADGSQLPPAGNPSPPQTPTPADAAAAAAAAGAAGNATAQPAGTARSAGSADAASAKGARAVAAAAPGGQGQVSAQGTGTDPLVPQTASGVLPGTADTLAGFMLSGDLPPGGTPAAGDVSAPPAAQPSVVQGSAGAVVQGGTGAGASAAGTVHGQDAGTAQNAVAVKDPATGNASVKQLSQAEATAAFNAATSGSSAAGGTGAAQNGGPADAAAAQAAAGTQTAAATAQSAAASGVVVVDPGFANAADSPASPVAPAAAATGSAAPGAPGSTGAPLPAAHAAVAPPAANAQALAALGDVGGSDKHAHGQNGDSSPGVSGDALAGAAQSGLNVPGTTDAGAAPTLRVAAGVDTQDFGQGLADRVSYMIGNNLNGAKLQVNPPQLGPIEVRIAVQGDHAQVWLTSHSAVTRDALEASTPRLRDMLGAQGFGQVSVDISQRSFQDRSPQPQHYDWTPAAVRSVSPVSASASVSSLSRLSNSAVDAYA